MGIIPDIAYADTRLRVPSEQIGSEESVRAAGYADNAAVFDKALGASMEREATTRAAADFAEYQGKMMERMNQLEIERQAEPDGFTGVAMQQYDEMFGEYLERSDNPFYQEIMKERAATFKNNIMNGAMNFEARQKTDIQMARLKQSEDILAANVYKNPAMAASALAQAEGNLKAASALALIPNYEERLLNARSAIHGMAIEGYLSSGKTGAASEYLKKNGGALGTDGVRYGERIKNAVEAQAAAAAQAKYFGEAVQGSAYVDPANKAQRSAINNQFVSAGLLNGVLAGDEAALGQTMQLIKNTSVVPESLQSTLRGAMANGDLAAKERAYGLVGQIQRVNPAALTGPAGFTEGEVKDAAVFNSLVASGAESKMALKAIEDAHQPLMKDVRDMRAKAANKALESLSPGQITDMFDSVFTSEPALSAAMRDSVLADYRNVYAESYMQYGDDSTAKAAAEAAVKARAGVTYVGGKKRLMKFPPENYYGTTLKDESARSEALTSQLEVYAKSIGAKVDDLELVPANSTPARIASGKKPVYYLMRENDGAYDFIYNEKNAPVVWAFDDEEIIKKRKDEADKIKKEGEARGKYDGTPTFRMGM